MRNSQKEEISRLMSRINRYGTTYTYESNAQGLSLFKDGDRISPILKPSAFIEWIYAFSQGQEEIFSRFGLTLVQVTNGLRESDFRYLPSLSGVEITFVDKFFDDVLDARKVYYNDYV